MISLRARTFGGRFVLWLAVSVLAAPITARAQSSQATLQGQVIGLSDGRPLAGALVLHRNLLTGTQGYGYTNEQGIFYFPAMPPGVYSVRVDALGYQPEERSPIDLAVASRVEVKFALQGGAQIPTTAPSPSAPPLRAKSNPNDILATMYGADAAVPQAMLVRLPVAVTDTLTGTLSSLIDENKILELPLAGRDVYTLLVLQPSVSSDNATARGLGFSVNGQQVASSNFLLDGVDNNDLLITGPATFVSADAVKEYRMSTNNFTAEYGRSAGFIANAITRSGTNQIHGTVFEFLNRDELNANSFSNNWQGIERPKVGQHQYGGSIGGPIRKERLFFFGNFEQSRSSGKNPPVSAFLPSTSLVSLAQPGSRAKQLFDLFPPPQGDPIPGFPWATVVNYSQPTTQRNTFGMGRADYNPLDGRQRISSRYSFSQQFAHDFNASVYPGWNSPLEIQTHNLSLNYTRDLAGGTNELKFGLNKKGVETGSAHPGLPSFQPNDGILLPGNPAAFDYEVHDTVLHVLDAFGLLSGRHALGMGFEWRPGFHDSLYTPLQDGLYTFDSVFSFLTDTPFSLTIPLNRQTGLPTTNEDFEREYFLNEGALFFQDNLKLTRRFTLNLGLRWEYFGAPGPRNDTVDYNFVFGEGTDVYQRIANGSMQAAELFQPDRNNFAPRFGFAYDLFGTGRSVLRGGYGIYFDRIFNNFWMDARSNNVALAALLNFDSRGLPTNQFAYTFPASSGVASGRTAVPASDIAVDQGLRTPYSQSWFLGGQHELRSNLVVELNTAGSLGRKLAASDIINRIFSVPTSATNPDGRINPSAPQILHRNNQGRSDYVALQAAANRRWSRGLQFQVSYTLSRARDVQSDALGRRTSGGGASPIADTSFFFAPVSSFFTRQFDPNSDYGNADFDQRHNLIFNFIWQTPYMVGTPKALSGWQMSTVAGFRSGFPFSVVSNSPDVAQAQSTLGFFYVDPHAGLLMKNRADFLGNDPDEAFLQPRPEVPGGVVLLDASEFRKPPAYRLGNVARNNFRGPGFWNVDFSLNRTFAVPQISEQANLQFRIEFFNVFNHANLNNPDSSLDSSTFGQASFGRQGTSSSLPVASPLNEAPRHVQLAVKLYF